MPLPSEQHQNTTSGYTPCKTDTRRGMIKHMHGCLGKVPPDRSLFNMSDYIIQHTSLITQAIALGAHNLLNRKDGQTGDYVIRSASSDMRSV